ELITDIAGRERTISETAAELIEIGIAVRREGIEPNIVGPLGIPRPFAKINLGDQTSELRTEVSDEIVDELVDLFSNKPNTAAREAIRLGILAVAENEFTVEGPVGDPRPFAKIKVDQIDSPEIVELVNDLRSRL
ncbi:MAG: hypothetical protein ABEI86_09725, partial [Halobacteriaceae archaeon]